MSSSSPCLGHSGSVSRLNFRLGFLSFRHCGGMAGALPGSIGQADLGRNHSYKFIYSGVFAADPDGRNLLILLVGAGRFERPTPCAQGGWKGAAKVACFQLLAI